MHYSTAAAAAWTGINPAINSCSSLCFNHARTGKRDSRLRSKNYHAACSAAAGKCLAVCRDYSVVGYSSLTEDGEGASPCSPAVAAKECEPRDSVAACSAAAAANGSDTNDLPGLEF